MSYPGKPTEHRERSALGVGVIVLFVIGGRGSTQGSRDASPAGAAPYPSGEQPLSGGTWCPV